MTLRKLALGALAAMAATAALTATTASARDDYFYSAADNAYYPIVYAYVFYSDPEKTQVTGEAIDQCIGGNVTNPNITTPYYDEEPRYACAGIGPYLPSDWPY